MALTRNFKETVIGRVQIDASFAQALLSMTNSCDGISVGIGQVT